VGECARRAPELGDGTLDLFAVSRPFEQTGDRIRERRPAVPAGAERA
jgi:hypothetical protein